MEDNFPKVSLVIPVFNEERYIAACLDSIASLNYEKQNLEVILVDNGSTDKTLDIAKDYEVNIFIKEGVNVGAVRNYGVTKARGDIVVFLDSDCVVDKDWLMEGVRKLHANNNLVLGGQYLMREDPSWLEKFWVLNNSKTQVYQTTLVGGCIFLPKATFESVGGFDESLSSGEDSELTLKLRKAGFEVTIDASLSVIHLGYPSTISSFVMRQAWHSADYISNLPRSLKDKIFILTILFIFCFIGSVLCLILSLDLLGPFIILFFLTPLLLSFKRVARSKANISTFFDYASVYCVDFLYLVGRSVGVLKGVRKLFIKSATSKVARR